MGYSSYALLLLVCVCWVLPTLITGDDDAASSLVISPHCSAKCGDLSIPYPFGIEEGCYYKPPNYETFSSFKIKCSNATNPPTPILLGMEVLGISVEEGELRSKSRVSYDCYNKSSRVQRWFERFNLGTFTLSSPKNILVAIGCCQAAIPCGVNNVTVQVDSPSNRSSVNGFIPCNVAFPVAKDAFKFNEKYLGRSMEYYQALAVPMVFNWTVGRDNCSVAKAGRSCLCKGNTECYDPMRELGYRCRCKDGYSGNPYHPSGCRDIDECKEANDCEKSEYCINTNGSYYCKCPRRYHGNGTKTSPCVSNRKPWFTPVMATAGLGGGIIMLLLFGFLLHFIHGQRQIKKMREVFFRQNGGLLLHEKLSGRHADALQIFTMQDLEVACNNYSDENIIGRGGFGIVYKGILPDNQVVAIKKSLKVDPNQVDQFINEVLVLSQINNKNVVRLLGCCLESEVPLLVYEFINNGTLYDHLHDVVKASMLKWQVRVKIASEVANVLSYLHNTISTPIIHRDIKSMNILLDESYTAKVTDFGASRLVPPDQSQLATIVLGTRGYLDPEYLQTSELTEKSDVYSFGVVLVELLTRKNAFSITRPEAEKCLAMHFLLKIKEGLLLNILDINIVSEKKIEEIQQMANLAKRCLMLKGEERPAMKEVAIELETIKRKGFHPWNDDGSVQEDCESFFTGISRLDHGGCSSGIESNSYDSHLLSSLESGR